MNSDKQYESTNRYCISRHTARVSAGDGRRRRRDAHGGRAAAASGRRNGAAIEHPAAKADACILLWMAGGMAAPETFDPKRYEPFEVGLPVEKVMSTFPAIDTVVDNIKITPGAGAHRPA